MTKHVDLRLPADLAASMDERVAKTDLSRNAWICRVIEWALEQPLTDRPQPPTKV